MIIKYPIMKMSKSHPTEFNVPKIFFVYFEFYLVVMLGKYDSDI